jgi:hypothetical protein
MLAPVGVFQSGDWVPVAVLQGSGSCVTGVGSALAGVEARNAGSGVFGALQRFYFSEYQTASVRWDQPTFGWDRSFVCSMMMYGAGLHVSHALFRYQVSNRLLASISLCFLGDAVPVST